jgi:transposase
MAPAPKKYGKRNSVYKHFWRWCGERVWQQMHEHFANDADMEHILPDRSVIHALLVRWPKKGSNLPKH